MKWQGLWIACALASTMPACDPETDEDTGAAGTDDGDASGDDDANADGSGGDAAGFANTVGPVLTANCSCHITGAGGLSFGDDAYAAIVGVAAAGADLNYIEPNDVEASYIVHKIRGTQDSVGGGGDVMPPGGMVSDADVQTIVDWIEAGAPE
ncbi:MAG: hypothetical protein AAF799_07330 [Myxococcota bacterium]